MSTTPVEPSGPQDGRVEIHVEGKTSLYVLAQHVCEDFVVIHE